MSDRPQAPLQPILINLDGPEYEEILRWPFEGEHAYVSRLLRRDVPQSVRFTQGQVWVYLDLDLDPKDQLVGFGVVDVCDEYRDYTSGLTHPYLRLLAVKPKIQSRRYGTSIVQHLIGQASVLIRRGGCALDIYLDVYVDNTKGIGLYERLGFERIGEKATPDDLEDGRPYIVMTRRASFSGKSSLIVNPPDLSSEATYSDPPAAP